MATASRTGKHEAARNSLPVELQPVLDQLIDEYKFATTVHHGRGFASPMVLAELIRAGWRPSGEPVLNWVQPKPSREDI